MRSKKRNINVFSLSFLDCICCGFGAVLLLFILTAKRQIIISEEDASQSVRAAETLQTAIEEAEAKQKSLDKDISALDPQPDTNATSIAELAAEQTKETRERSTRRIGIIAGVIAAIVGIIVLFNVIGGGDDESVGVPFAPTPVPEGAEQEAAADEPDLLDAVPADFVPFAGDGIRQLGTDYRIDALCFATCQERPQTVEIVGVGQRQPPIAQPAGGGANPLRGAGTPHQRIIGSHD